MLACPALTTLPGVTWWSGGGGEGGGVVEGSPRPPARLQEGGAREELHHDALDARLSLMSSLSLHSHSRALPISLKGVALVV